MSLQLAKAPHVQPEDCLTGGFEVQGLGNTCIRHTPQECHPLALQRLVTLHTHALARSNLARACLRCVQDHLHGGHHLACNPAQPLLGLLLLLLLLLLLQLKVLLVFCCAVSTCHCTCHNLTAITDCSCVFRVNTFTAAVAAAACVTAAPWALQSLLQVCECCLQCSHCLSSSTQALPTHRLLAGLQLLQVCHLLLQQLYLKLNNMRLLLLQLLLQTVQLLRQQHTALLYVFACMKVVLDVI
jgi:hypothetical protein